MNLNLAILKHFLRKWLNRILFMIAKNAHKFIIDFLWVA